MSTWQEVITLGVRHIIGDLGSTEIFTDARIQQSAVICALGVSVDYDFDTDYTFDISAVEIDPDPIAVGDNEAIALIMLKTACMLSTNQYQSAIKTGIRIRDGDSEVDTIGGFKGYSDILEKGPCYAYSKLLDKLTTKKSMTVGKAIFSPYTDDNSATWGINGNWQIRGFFDGFLRY